MAAEKEPTKEAELLRFHGHVGFSLGRYTELFMFPPHGIVSDEDPDRCTSRWCCRGLRRAGLAASALPVRQ